MAKRGGIVGPAQLLPAGSQLAKWIAFGGSPIRENIFARPLYRWKGFWFDLNWRQQSQLYPHSLASDDAGDNLLFVMGFWRSGTTLIHELLAAGPHMAAPQTWQCMNPSAFRLTKPPRHDGSGVQRPMDSMIISLSSPQEDEFALLARGAPSIYRAWIDPRRWEEALPALSQDTWLNLPEDRWLTDWKHFLGWCMQADTRTLVVKSPNHVFRLKAIHRAWSKARFIWILRDPADVWHSNRKMWQAMAGMYSLWKWHPEDFDRVIYEAFKEYGKALRWAMDTFSPEQMIVVGYGQLTERTSETLQNMVRTMGLGNWNDWQLLVQPQLDSAAKHKKEGYEASLPLPEYGLPLVEEIRKLHLEILTCHKQFG